jgi:hypothetical protein
MPLPSGSFCQNLRGHPHRVGFVSHDCWWLIRTGRVRLAGSRGSNLKLSGSFGQIVWQPQRIRFILPRWDANFGALFRALGLLGSFGQAAGRERSVESPDREFSTRQRAPLIAVERSRPNDRGVIEWHGGKKLAARAANAHDFDLRRRDHARHLEAFPAAVAPCDRPRQSSDLLRQCGIKRRRPAQAMAERIARAACLALRRLRTSAGAAIPAAGFPPGFADHGCPLLLQFETDLFLIYPKRYKMTWQAENSQIIAESIAKKLPSSAQAWIVRLGEWKMIGAL